MEEEDALKKVPAKYNRVRNKAAAPVQITAEQLLREAYERRLERVPPAPKTYLGESTELDAMRLAKRKDFEDRLRKNKINMGTWYKYAKFEESCGELDRCRSIFERALEIDHRVITTWLRYAETEMRHKQLNHARNIWDRAVLTMPRVNQFWYKYTYMEEILGNVHHARQVFERWMQWQPHEQAWLSYIKMELRYKEVNRARSIYERFVIAHSEVENWIRFARFERRFSNNANARIVFEKAIEFFSKTGVDPKLFLAFAKFEEQCGEFDRAKVIFKYALEHTPKEQAQCIIDEYGFYEKRHGDCKGIEDVIVKKRLNMYKNNVETNSYDYDSWINLLRLLENESYPSDVVREYYEKAISNFPPVQEKKHWTRYIYFWIMYALYEECVTKDFRKAREIYRACLDFVPHKKFTFAKIWIIAANFEIRNGEFTAFRKLMGKAVGMCPKYKLFNYYIEIEFHLREFDRCRKLYDKYLEFSPNQSLIWIRYAEMESLLGNTERSRSLYKLAVTQTNLNVPELVWKSFIDFEISQNEPQNVRVLYDDLLERSNHAKVWINYAKFELQLQHENNVNSARVIFQRAAKFFREQSKDDENTISQRISLLQAWHDFEKTYGNDIQIEDVERKLPKKIKKKRRIANDIIDKEDVEYGWEEYFEYTFPEDMEKQANFKLLKMAYEWNKKNATDT